MSESRRLANGRSPRWAFWDRFEVPSYDDPTGRPYLTRWRIIRTPWFGLYLHRLEGPDPRQTLHDHPWSFVSLVLRGGYLERRLDPLENRVRYRHVRRVNVKRRADAHSIVSLDRNPTWTLLLVGRETRKWGYLEWHGAASTAWLWTPFDEHPHAEEFARALAARKAAA